MQYPFRSACRILKAISAAGTERVPQATPFAKGVACRFWLAYYYPLINLTNYSATEYMCRCSPSAVILALGQQLKLFLEVLWITMHFEASGTASGYEIEKTCRLHIYNTLLCVPCNIGIRKTCLEYW